MLPDTLFFEASKEPFDHPILLRRIRRDEFLLELVVATGLPKQPTLEDQPIVTAEACAPTGRSIPNRWRQVVSTARSSLLRQNPLRGQGFNCSGAGVLPSQDP